MIYTANRQVLLPDFKCSLFQSVITFFHFYFLFDDHLILSKELDTPKKQDLETMLGKLRNFIHEGIIIFRHFAT